VLQDKVLTSACLPRGPRNGGFAQRRISHQGAAAAAYISPAETDGKRGQFEEEDGRVLC